MKEVFETSVGTVEVRIDLGSRTIGAYRLDDQRRTMAAAIEAWDYADLVDVFSRQIGVPVQEANRIADAVRAQLPSGPPPARVDGVFTEYERLVQAGTLDRAGLPRRFVAVVLDALIVLLPLQVVVGLLYGGGYVERGNGETVAGVEVTGMAGWLVLVAFLTYYTLGEALTGGTLGKGIVKIRVVGERGEHPSLGAAVVRNLLRPVDALFFYLVGAGFALASPLGQRLGDRAAHTVVVRR
jgi:uncharacterized RDD family membrane protein YckC